MIIKNILVRVGLWQNKIVVYTACNLKNDKNLCLRTPFTSEIRNINFFKTSRQN